jgi:hypothetical protein
MDSCYQEKVCNCKRDCECEEGYECCSEDTKNPTMGLCVKKNTCNKKTGFCSSGKTIMGTIKEMIYNPTRENFTTVKELSMIDYIVASFFAVIIVFLLVKIVKNLKLKKNIYRVTN